MTYLPPNAYNIDKKSGTLANNFWAAGEQSRAVNKLKSAGCKSYEFAYIRGKGKPTSNEQLIDRLL
jgi:hypothetical protein